MRDKEVSNLDERPFVTQFLETQKIVTPKQPEDISTAPRVYELVNDKVYAFGSAQ
jgi:hypothetical protein